MQRLALIAVPFLALAPTLGCSASVAGEVDGEAVATLFSALYVEDEDDIGEDTITSVSATGLSVLDGCNGAAKKQANTNELQDQLNGDLEDAAGDVDEIKDAMETFANGIVDYDKENTPTDFWAVSIGAASADDGEIDGGKAEIKFDEAPTDDVIGFLSVCRINDHPSVGEDDNDFPIVETDADCWSAIEADIEIVKWEKETAFEAKATATLGDFEDFLAGDEDEPKDVGDVEISISAGHCAPLQDALEEAEDIAEDAAG